MTEKIQIIKELAADELLLPKLISEALIANDKAKYFFALLQSAQAHADNPDIEIANLQTERIASGVSDTALDQVAISATLRPDGRYQIPQVRRLIKDTVSCAKEMMKPLELAGPAYREVHEKYSARLDTIMASLGDFDNETVSGLFIDELTSGEPKNGDSLHLLVMELHRELNTLQSKVYQESIESASVYGLDERDRPLVSAFMKGVNQTAKLKFDHAGLATTATRSGEVLMIQNDIGETEAHVLVIKVTENRVGITCTDIHRQRLTFFQSMLQKFDVRWRDTVSKQSKNLQESEFYYLSTGTYEAKDESDLKDYLGFVGSRLVFLIDWNRARKQLRLFLTRGDTFDVLKWASDNNLGHMGFLKMGGDKLLLNAIEQSTNVSLRFGSQFYDVLGKKRAVEFLKFVLKTCSEGLMLAKSETLMRDEIRAELAECFSRINEDLFSVASRHASLVVELATAVKDDLVAIESDGLEFLKRNAERGKGWESQADALLNRVRLAVKRSNAPLAFEKMLSHSDDVADSLEDALFLLSLTSKKYITGSCYEHLLELSEIVARGSMEYLKAIENSKTFQKWSPREEVDDFLEAVDEVLALEHEADEAYRSVKANLIANATDYKLQTVLDISKDIEEAADSLMKSAIALKDYMLEEVMAA